MTHTKRFKNESQDARRHDQFNATHPHESAEHPHNKSDLNLGKKAKKHLNKRK